MLLVVAGFAYLSEEEDTPCRQRQGCRLGCGMLRSGVQHLAPTWEGCCHHSHDPHCHSHHCSCWWGGSRDRSHSHRWPQPSHCPHSAQECLHTPPHTCTPPPSLRIEKTPLFMKQRLKVTPVHHKKFCNNSYHICSGNIVCRQTILMFLYWMVPYTTFAVVWIVFR